MQREYAWYSKRLEEGAISPGTGVRGGFKQPDVCAGDTFRSPASQPPHDFLVALCFKGCFISASCYFPVLALQTRSAFSP